MSGDASADSEFRTSFKVALSLFKAGRYEEALDGFNKCIDISDRPSTVYDARAATFEKLGRSKEALKDARRVIELCPESGKGYVRAGRLFLNLNRFDAALETCAMAFERVSDQDKMSELSKIQADASSRHAAALSARACHIDKLPVELIAAIFLEWKRIDRAAPVVASHVSRRWRSIALSTPILWTSLVLGSRKPMQKAMLWMDRCKGRLLELVVDINFRETQHLPDIKWFQDMLATASKSLLSLNFDVKYRMRELILLALSAEPNLPLQSLRVSAGLQSAVRAPPFILPPNFKCLESLHLAHYQLTEHLPCPRLKVLHVQPHFSSALRLAGYLELLRSLPDLEELHLYNGLFDEVINDLTEVEPVVAMESLRVIALSGLVVWPRLLRRLAVPSLHTFRMERCSKPYVAELLSHFSEQRSPLADVSIIASALTETDMSSLFPRFPVLNRLEITQSSNIQNSFIEELASSPDRWPNLEHVNFSDCPMVSGGPLLRLVRSRLPRAEDPVGEELPRPPLTIKSIVVDGCEKVEVNVVQYLKGVVEHVSCVYQKKEQIRQRRRRDL